MRSHQTGELQSLGSGPFFGEYDSAGRVILDSATIPTNSTGVDQTVLSIGTSYDDLGRVQFVTSYPNANGTGVPVNQVEDQYDGWGNLSQEWQSSSSSVNMTTTPSVQYTYADGANGTGVAAYMHLRRPRIRTPARARLITIIRQALTASCPSWARSPTAAETLRRPTAISAREP